MEAEALGVKEEKEGEDGEPRGSGGCYGPMVPVGGLWPQKVQS